MRHSFFLLAAAVALFSSATEVSATVNKDIITTSSQVLSSEVEGRRLRVHKIPSDDTEDRGFNTQKFDQLLSDQGYRTKRFRNWVKKQYTDTAIYNKVKADSYPKYRVIFHKYQNYLENAAPHLITP